MVVGLFIFGILVIIALGAMMMLFGWAVIGVFRLFIRGVFGAGRYASRSLALPTMVCRRERCRTANPPGARFCRRCGVSLQPQPMRRVAMW